MTKDRFQGDPALFLGKNGAYLFFTGGQCIMDTGLENAEKISLNTREGWCGNSLIDDENAKIGSKFEAENEKAITLTSLNDRRDSAEKALEWMTKTGLANQIIVDLQNVNSNVINYQFLTIPPGKDENKLLITTNGINWIEQKNNPAHGKI